MAALGAVQRFGWVVQLYVTGIMLVTMGTAMTVEYTTVGSLFSIIIGAGTVIPIVVIIGVVSSAYTASGGLHVSLITDQVQVPPPPAPRGLETRFVHCCCFPDRR